MTKKIVFNRDFDPQHGIAVRIAPSIRRITAPNPGPTTFHGTNTYVVGAGKVAVIDPGPADASHLAAVLAAIARETVTHIIVTHTHRDHSSAVAALQDATGAITVGAGPHTPARQPRRGETDRLDAAGDTDFRPDIVLADRDTIAGETWRLEAVATPGHTTNHLALALGDDQTLLSGDHVMGWSTTIVAPPDGAMRDYMASLDKLVDRVERRYLPGHGGPIEDAHTYVRALKRHRLMREAAILDRLVAGDRTIPEIVGAIYTDTPPQLHRAAGLSVLAHLEDLVAAGQAVSEGLPVVDGRYEPASPKIRSRALRRDLAVQCRDRERIP